MNGKKIWDDKGIIIQPVCYKKALKYSDIDIDFVKYLFFISH